LAKLDVERRDLETEAARAADERAAAEDALGRAREAMEALRVERAARESQLAVARSSREAVGRDLSARERDLAGVSARLRSLEELDAARAEYGEGARAILAESGEAIRHMGSVADHLDVDVQYERAVEAALGDLLQHVVVRTHDDAAAGLAFVRERGAGRVGFVVAEGGPAATDRGEDQLPADPSIVPLGSVLRISGAAADAIRVAAARVWLAPTRESALAASSNGGATVATLEGDVYRGAHRVEGGERAESRSILTTKREIKELRERLEEDTASLTRVREEAANLDVAAAAAESAIASLQQELHRQEKAIVGFELQRAAAGDARDRVARKQEQIAIERRSGEDELNAQERREAEARESIRRIESEQRNADEQLSAAQRRLFEARENAEQEARRTAEAKAAHAALVERASALSLEIGRLEDAARELDQRVVSRSADLERNTSRGEELRRGIVESERQLAIDLRDFDDLKDQVRATDETSQALRASFDGQEATIRDARRALETVRAEATQLEIERATAESDLAHLATSCIEALQATLDEVAAQVQQMERDGLLASPRAVDDAPDASETDGAAPESNPAVADPAVSDAAPAAASRALTPDEMVADLRQKIERMGAVNMMAIDQFDDLESRHTFLTAQRKDLVDSIAATNEAIRKIDKTTKERFQEAFAVINTNFEQTFTTLFGGGKAGLVLLDETDALESGIDIIAQPPGKRLQSVQLLSGGEKALTAMALMFAIFKYRPSPFCLLDEIDAPLDDANIGRFVEMLQGMQEHTQFILITHNRKTMEIANRLYGVTMEEPGVSKLISLQLN
ncbi:MAG TPA: hypothetical protein VNR64_20910, partial [Vicinamibacterales bacterium]|nr:hypothetical protein [Vicinamibacterales bacterium]